MKFICSTRYFLLGLSFVLFWACKPTQNGEGEEDVLLAKVYNKPLYLSELEGMIPGGSSPEDSNLIINAYVDRWVQEALVMHEAEKNIPKDLNIDELVRDYRASLVRHNYEQLIVATELDSTISQSELQNFYKEHKEEYVLKYPIVRCHFIKIPQDQEGEEEMEELWEANNQEDFTKLLDYCSKFASVYMLDDSTWYKAPDIAEQLPKGFLKIGDLTAGKDFATTQDGYRYLLRINEMAPKSKIAPLSYVSDQASKVILHKRKIKLLEEKKKEIYNRGLKLKNIEFFKN